MAKTFSPKEYLQNTRRYEDICHHEVIYYDYDSSKKKYSNKCHCLLCEKALNIPVEEIIKRKDVYSFCKYLNENQEDLILKLVEYLAIRYYYEDKIDLVYILNTLSDSIDDILKFVNMPTEKEVYSPKKKIKDL